MTISWDVSFESGDTATAADLADLTGSVTFVERTSAQVRTFNINTNNDALAEGAETFTMTPRAPAGGVFAGGIRAITGSECGTPNLPGLYHCDTIQGTIEASDAALVSVGDAGAVEGTAVVFTVTLSNSPASDVTVEYATSLAADDTASADDFTPSSGSVHFAAEATGAGLRQTFTVATTEDALAEGDETFTVTLSEPAAGFPPNVSLDDAAARGTIRARRARPARNIVPVSVSVGDAGAAEGDAVSFTVTLSESPASPVTVNYATGLAAGDTASADDFTQTSGSVRFAAGATGAGLRQTFTVATTDDALAEGDETFTVMLSGAGGRISFQASALAPPRQAGRFGQATRRWCRSATPARRRAMRSSLP